MLKRVIFSLLYGDGYFMLSRNFRLQRVGDLHWLRNNYNFSRVATSIDELVILDVSRQERDRKRFCEIVRNVVSDCFIPVAVGGGVVDLNGVQELMHAGADKVVLNSALVEHFEEISKIAEVVGAQSLVASVDVKRGDDGTPVVYIESGNRNSCRTLDRHIKDLVNAPIGELYLQSIDRDGTGNGLDLGLVADVRPYWNRPLILAGGVGHSTHIRLGLSSSGVDAVATANLLNFVGDGLRLARLELRDAGVRLAQFDPM
jgi:cyclase